MIEPRIGFAGDSCLSVAFDEAIDPQVNRRCVALAKTLERQEGTRIRDIVPGFHTVAIYFDPLSVAREQLAIRVRRAVDVSVPPDESAVPPLQIVVRYGGVDGPDLPAVARFADCSEAEVVRLHTSGLYRVFMLGFLPGFAYLASVDRRIAMPRLDTPRTRVPAGAVGIAGVQTAVYPCDTPGGWRIIGRTEAIPFDPSRPEPFLFSPGQQVRFVGE